MVDDILNWSEAWSLLIPLVAFITHRRQPYWMQPLILYIIVFFPYNLLVDALTEMEINNTVMYHAHSIIRFSLILIFFYRLRMFKPSLLWVSAVLFAIGMITIGITTINPFIPNPHVNGDLMALESFCCLLPCMAYYLYLLLKSEIVKFTRLKSFWTVTALTVYFTANFFLFFYYNSLITEDNYRAADIWNTHNLSYIFFGIMFAVAIVIPDSQEE